MTTGREYEGQLEETVRITGDGGDRHGFGPAARHEHRISATDGRGCARTGSDAGNVFASRVVALSRDTRRGGASPAHGRTAAHPYGVVVHDTRFRFHTKRPYKATARKRERPRRKTGPFYFVRF